MDSSIKNSVNSGNSFVINIHSSPSDSQNTNQSTRWWEGILSLSYLRRWSKSPATNDHTQNLIINNLNINDLNQEIEPLRKITKEEITKEDTSDYDAEDESDEENEDPVKRNKIYPDHSGSEEKRIVRQQREALLHEDYEKILKRKRRTETDPLARRTNADTDESDAESDADKSDVDKSNVDLIPTMREPTAIVGLMQPIAENISKEQLHETLNKHGLLNSDNTLNMSAIQRFINYAQDNPTKTVIGGSLLFGSLLLALYASYRAILLSIANPSLQITTIPAPYDLSQITDQYLNLSAFKSPSHIPLTSVPPNNTLVGLTVAFYNITQQAIANVTNFYNNISLFENGSVTTQPTKRFEQTTILPENSINSTRTFSQQKYPLLTQPVVNASQNLTSLSPNQLEIYDPPSILLNPGETQFLTTSINQDALIQWKLWNDTTEEYESIPGANETYYKVESPGTYQVEFTLRDGRKILTDPADVSVNTDPHNIVIEPISQPENGTLTLYAQNIPPGFHIDYWVRRPLTPDNSAPWEVLNDTKSSALNININDNNNTDYEYNIYFKRDEIAPQSRTRRQSNYLIAPKITNKKLPGPPYDKLKGHEDNAMPNDEGYGDNVFQFIFHAGQWVYRKIIQYNNPRERIDGLPEKHIDIQFGVNRYGENKPTTEEPPVQMTPFPTDESSTSVEEGIPCGWPVVMNNFKNPNDLNLPGLIRDHGGTVNIYHASFPLNNRTAAYYHSINFNNPNTIGDVFFGPPLRFGPVGNSETLRQFWGTLTPLDSTIFRFHTSKPYGDQNVTTNWLGRTGPINYNHNLHLHLTNAQSGTLNTTFSSSNTTHVELPCGNTLSISGELANSTPPTHIQMHKLGKTYIIQVNKRYQNFYFSTYNKDGKRYLYAKIETATNLTFNIGDHKLSIDIANVQPLPPQMPPPPPSPPLPPEKPIAPTQNEVVRTYNDLLDNKHKAAQRKLQLWLEKEPHLKKQIQAYKAALRIYEQQQVQYEDRLREYAQQLKVHRTNLAIYHNKTMPAHINEVKAYEKKWGQNNRLINQTTIEELENKCVTNRLVQLPQQPENASRINQSLTDYSECFWRPLPMDPSKCKNEVKRRYMVMLDPLLGRLDISPSFLPWEKARFCNITDQTAETPTTDCINNNFDTILKNQKNFEDGELIQSYDNYQNCFPILPTDPQACKTELGKHYGQIKIEIDPYDTVLSPQSEAEQLYCNSTTTNHKDTLKKS